MSAALADFGRDYRSVNVQRPCAYLLVRNPNLFDSRVRYQLKCCSVADNAAPHCHMVWSGAACCRQGHQWVAWTAAHLCESWWTTLWTFALSRKLLWFYCFMTLLRLRVWHAVKLLLALQRCWWWRRYCSWRRSLATWSCRWSRKIASTVLWSPR